MAAVGETKRALPSFLNVAWGVRDILMVVLAWFGSQIILGIILALLSHRIAQVGVFMAALRDGEVVATFALYLVGVIFGLGLVAIYLKHYRVGWSEVGWRRVSFKKTMKYLAIALVGFLVIANVALIVIKLLVPSFDANQPQVNEFTHSIDSNRTIALIALVLLPPIFEETIFRGFIFPALAKRSGVVVGAIFSSMIFGIAHAQPNLFVYTTILGLLLCFMYVRMRSIVPGIFLHMLNNYLAFWALSGK